MEFSSVLEAEFYRRITVYLEANQLDEKYTIEYQPRLQELSLEGTKRRRIPDFLILKGGFPFVIVEIKGERLQLENALSMYVELAEIGVDWIIATDLEGLLLYETSTKISEYRSFDFVYNLFRDERDQGRKIDDTILSIENEINEILFGDKDIDLKPLLQSGAWSDFIEYNKDGRFFSFKDNRELGLQNFENRLFSHLLKPVTSQVVCRYTTLEATFQMINKKTFRMGSNMAMNDRGEIDYADKYLGIYYKPLDKMSLKEMQRLNLSFISSCTTQQKEDDLTMYRLYGEDSRGTCLCFNVVNGVQDQHMLIREVSYGRSRNDHPELTILRKIIDNLHAKFKVRFRFLFLDTWKHFFKSHDYESEKEIRLLYLDNNKYPPKEMGWVLTHPDKVLSRYVFFELNSRHFPLQLYKIILGPNCPDPVLNRKQFGVLLEERNLKRIEVANSDIESYRKS
ncbi:DUF2971 domain-containing protein [Fulvivirgaceae bacterium PWU4]|uniref:DUF2971 domain-containing protein n=1 Tax=Chryseosolibacter histidini TaxID=2782349 RepID=A0AAP2DH07_9BACT|nr:DUF2971 domain-containing protein [Chryseosolibacter histidini]MBT1696071.1 DUF2971 domain-containing protein [Chryseosolibacter histidini]